MGVRVTLTFVRPNTGVAWHTLSSSQHNYCETNYIDTGKKTSGVETCKSGLTLRRVTEFTDTGMTDWNSDSTIQAMVSEIRAYYDGVNITQAKAVENI